MFSQYHKYKIKLNNIFISRFDPEYVQKIKRSGRFGMNTFGYFNGVGLNQLIEIETKFTSKDYINLLKEEILPAIREKYPPPQKVYFVQDQCPIHMAKGVKNFFSTEENLEIIQLPPKGADLNPIENIWGVISQKIKVDPAWEIDEFRMNVLAAWEFYMEKEGYLEKLSMSMTDRMMHVIGMNGHWTKY